MYASRVRRPGMGGGGYCCAALCYTAVRYCASAALCTAVSGTVQCDSCVLLCCTAVSYHHLVLPCRTAMPYCRTIPPCSTAIPYCRAVQPCHTAVPYRHAVPPCRTAVPYRRAACLQVIEQLNCRLEEENRALMLQLATLLTQNQDLLTRSLESKDYYHEEQRNYL